MAKPAPITLQLTLEGLQAAFATVPESYGIYALRSRTHVLHLSWSAHLRRRLIRLLNPARPSGQRLTQLLSEHAAHIECWPCPSWLDTSIEMYALAREFYPSDYLKRLRLRIPWFVALSQDAYPRLVVSNRLASGSAPTIGPFLSREAASRYEDAVLSLFQIRRCTDTLHPSPDHTGCIYGEMNLCLRPCQLHVSASEYNSEAGRVSEFLRTAPDVAVASLVSARDRAAEQLEFEYASELHKQLERVRLTQAARPEIALDIEKFNGVALTPGCSPGEFRLRPMLSGCWQEAVSFRVDFQQPQSESLDSRLRCALDCALRETAPGANRLEHLALFSRWYHSSNRVGDWFPFESRTGIPYRRIARGLSRFARQQISGRVASANENGRTSAAAEPAPTNSPAPQS